MKEIHGRPNGRRAEQITLDLKATRNQGTVRIPVGHRGSHFELLRNVNNFLAAEQQPASRNGPWLHEQLHKSELHHTSICEYNEYPEADIG